MKSATADSATSPGGGHWDQIDWPSVHRRVRRLQTRIAKATRDQDWRRVKALQRFLVNSFSAKALAVKRVTGNDGKRTPGVDGEVWTTPGAKWKAIQRLSSRGLQPQPLRRVHIPKRGGHKTRPLGIPTMIDRAQQAQHLLGLEPVAETQADPHSFGFRRGRGTHDAIRRVFSLTCRKTSAQWILEGDIKGCFDNISHGWLKSRVLMDKQVLSAWLKAGYVENGKLFPTTAGTPQGGIASPTLANIALDGLEPALMARFGQTPSIQNRLRVRLARYADDFIITGVSKELLEQEVKPFVAAFLAERGLELSQDKTKITHVAEGFDFLGQNVRRYGGKLLIKPSDKNVKAFLSAVRETIRAHCQAKQETLIYALNPMIRGWAQYHRHIAAKQTYASVDHHIWKALWRWARRRHPMKSGRWVRKKYFHSKDFRHGVFATQTLGRDGTKRWLALYVASDTKIIRHYAVRADANPFDPAWDEYFAQRRRERMSRRLCNRETLKQLWKQQQGKCPGCGQLIDAEDRWRLAPIYSDPAGGNRTPADLVMLHLQCQRHFSANAGKQPVGGTR